MDWQAIGVCAWAYFMLLIFFTIHEESKRNKF